MVLFSHNSDGDNWKISREIHKDNTSKWSVNGRPSTQKAVSIKGFNLAFCFCLATDYCVIG